MNEREKYDVTSNCFVYQMSLSPLPVSISLWYGMELLSLFYLCLHLAENRKLLGLKAKYAFVSRRLVSCIVCTRLCVRWTQNLI